MIKVREKREFLSYVIKIQNHIKLQIMLKKYIQHRKDKHICTLKKCCLL